MVRLCALLIVLGFVSILLGWASAPAVDAMAPTVADGFADLERSIGVGCAAGIVVLAIFGGIAGLLIAVSSRQDQATRRYIMEMQARSAARAAVHRPELGASQAIEGQWYEVTDHEFAK